MIRHTHKAGDEISVGLGDGLEISMIYCPHGSFVMGIPPKPGDEDRSSYSLKYTTSHCVTLTKGFWIGKYTVSQQQFVPFIGRNPSPYKAANLPVVGINHKMCKWYAKKLNDFIGADVFRLPTEAEWEYACRAGTTGDFAGSGNLDEMGWYDGNSGGVLHPAGEKMPNGWGVHDMHGNVREWCDDNYSPYSPEAVVNPKVNLDCGNIVLRGGCYGKTSDTCASGSRFSDYGFSRGNAEFGFRIAANENITKTCKQIIL